MPRSPRADRTGTPPPRGSGNLTSLDFVRKLVSHGADVNFAKKSDGGNRLRISTKGSTPFLCAASTADVDYMKVLLELGADPKAVNAAGQNALMMAAMFNRTEIVDLLLERGADIDRQDATGHTALMAARIMNAPDTPSQLARAAERRQAQASNDRQSPTQP